MVNDREIYHSNSEHFGAQRIEVLDPGRTDRPSDMESESNQR